MRIQTRYLTRSVEDLAGRRGIPSADTLLPRQRKGVRMKTEFLATLPLSFGTGQIQRMGRKGWGSGGKASTVLLKLFQGTRSPSDDQAQPIISAHSFPYLAEKD